MELVSHVLSTSTFSIVLNNIFWVFGLLKL